MRTLDCYVAGLYYRFFGIFILGFLLLYVLIDFVGRVNDFINLPPGEDRLLFFARFYGYRLPHFITILLPMVTLFAAMVTSHRLARNNELVPMIAAGVSLRRVARPFFLTAAAVAGLTAALEEWALPRLGTGIVHTENVLRRGDTEANVFVRDRQGNTVYFESYRYSDFTADVACVARFGPDQRITELVVAAGARCPRPPDGDRPAEWRFYDGQITRYDAQLLRGEPTSLPPDGWPLETDLDPVDLARAEKVGTTFLSLDQLLLLIRDNPLNPVFPVRLHHRFAAPLGSVVLLLLGLPLVARTERHNLFLGIATCLLVCGTFYVAQFLCIDAGVKNALPPAASGWGPIAAFGSLGSAFFFGRMRT